MGDTMTVDNEGAAIDMNLVREVIDLRDKHVAVKLACDNLYAELKAAKDRLLEQFIASGTSQVRTDGGLVFVANTKRYTVAQGEDETKEQAIARAAELLFDLGLEGMVEVKTEIKTKELNDYLNEREQLGEAPDEALSGLLRTHVFTDIRVRS